MPRTTRRTEPIRHPPPPGTRFRRYQPWGSELPGWFIRSEPDGRQYLEKAPWTPGTTPGCRGVRPRPEPDGSWNWIGRFEVEDPPRAHPAAVGRTP